jgi:hypothetical protein
MRIPDREDIRDIREWVADQILGFLSRLDKIEERLTKLENDKPTKKGKLND